MRTLAPINKLPFWMRLVLGIKIIFGLYGSSRMYHNPSVGISQITLRHRKFDWR